VTELADARHRYREREVTTGHRATADRGHPVAWMTAGGIAAVGSASARSAVSGTGLAGPDQAGQSICVISTTIAEMIAVSGAPTRMKSVKR
jgi:hypothetical protein